MNLVERRNAIRQLAQFVSFATVSAQPEQFGRQFMPCANWLKEQLKSAGMDKSMIVPTKGFPVVYADWMGAGKRAPTVLIYGHYDIQPVDPISEWEHPPFEPVVKGEHLFGRGASDDKGQLFAHIKALEHLMKKDGKLPVNIRCLFEGEEEIGSPSLGAFLSNNKHLLRSDIALMSDTAMPAKGMPALAYGLRGVLYTELNIKSAIGDLHSGNFGGTVKSANQVLCELLVSIFKKDGSIAIGGFYDDIRPIPKAEETYILGHEPSKEMLLGAEAKECQFTEGGETGYSMYFRSAIRPSLTICGINGGYGGIGVKAVLPASASAKLDFRLVPGQDPVKVYNLLKNWVSKNLPKGFTFNMKRQLAIPAVAFSPGHPAIQAATTAVRQAFGKKPILIRSGGTVPVVHLLRKTLGIPTVMMGFGLPEDQVHAPNERFYLPNFFKGIAASRIFLEKVGSVPKTVSNSWEFEEMH